MLACCRFGPRPESAFVLFTYADVITALKLNGKSGISAAWEAGGESRLGLVSLPLGRLASYVSCVAEMMAVHTGFPRGLVPGH